MPISIRPTGTSFAVQKESALTSLKHRWLFEKYDGIRGFWNPLKKAMFSRQGRKFNLPQHILDAMPSNIFLDGELWYCFSIAWILLTQFCYIGLGGTTSRRP